MATLKYLRELWKKQTTSSLQAQVKAFQKLQHEFSSLKKQMQPLSLQLPFVFTSRVTAGFCTAMQRAKMTNLPDTNK